ncbi:hypothetical protein HDU97_007258 [Phlyctochytrium planicorne]|nr:hypothetical protein HDU97_007258 [Phlyctochytrium planicorne]
MPAYRLNQHQLEGLLFNITLMDMLFGSCDGVGQGCYDIKDFLSGGVDAQTRKGISKQYSKIEKDESGELAAELIDLFFDDIDWLESLADGIGAIHPRALKIFEKRLGGGILHGLTLLDETQNAVIHHASRIAKARPSTLFQTNKRGWTPTADAFLKGNLCLADQWAMLEKEMLLNGQEMLRPAKQNSGRVREASLDRAFESGLKIVEIGNDDAASSAACQSAGGRQARGDGEAFGTRAEGPDADAKAGLSKSQRRKKKQKENKRKGHGGVNSQQTPPLLQPHPTNVQSQQNPLAPFFTALSRPAPSFKSQKIFPNKALMDLPKSLLHRIAVNLRPPATKTFFAASKILHKMAASLEFRIDYILHNVYDAFRASVILLYHPAPVKPFPLSLFKSDAWVVAERILAGIGGKLTNLCEEEMSKKEQVMAVKSLIVLGLRFIKSKHMVEVHDDVRFLKNQEWRVWNAMAVDAIGNDSVTALSNICAHPPAKPLYVSTLAAVEHDYNVPHENKLAGTMTKVLTLDRMLEIARSLKKKNVAKYLAVMKVQKMRPNAATGGGLKQGQSKQVQRESVLLFAI